MTLLSVVIGVASTLGVLKQSSIGFFLQLPFLILIYIQIRAWSAKDKVTFSPLFLCYIAILCSYVVLQFTHINDEIDFTIYQLLLYLIVLCFFWTGKNFHIEKFFDGVLIGFWINVLFSMLAQFFWILNEFDLTKFVLQDLLNVDSGGHPYINFYQVNGIELVRLVGFSWDPMHIGLLCAVTYVVAQFRKKTTLEYIALAVLLLSGSRAGLLAVIGHVACQFVCALKNGKSDIRQILLFLVVVSSMIVLINLRDPDAEGNVRRLGYYIWTIEWINYVPTMNYIFGYGPIFSGDHLVMILENSKVYIPYFESLQEMREISNWKVEPDIFSILITRGVFGLALVILTSFIAIKKSHGIVKSVLILYPFLLLTYSYEFSIIFQLILVATLPCFQGHSTVEVKGA